LTAAERVAARKKRWHAEHPNYAREYRAAHLEQVLERHRATEKRYRERQKALREKALRNRERAATYYRRVKAENPQKLLEQARRDRAEHPERIRATQRAYYARNREQILQRHRDYRDATVQRKKELNKRWREANPHRVAEYRRARRENPEAYQRMLAQNREAKRLQSRLKQLGLPPKRVRRTTAGERRKNQVVADEFFTHQRIKTDFTPTPRESLEKWARFSALARRRFALQQRVGEYLEQHGDQLREEVMLDSQDRQVQGKSPLYVESEIVARARQALSAVRHDTRRPTGSARESNDHSKLAQNSLPARGPGAPDTGPRMFPGARPGNRHGLA